MPAISDGLTNTEILEEIGKRIRARRLERNITIDGMAAQIGANRKTVGDLEAGRDVRLSTLIKVLRQMNMLGTLEALLPDSLPSGAAYSTRGTIRVKAWSGLTHKPRGGYK